MGGALIGLSIVAGVTLFTVHREGRVYRADPPEDVEAGGRILVEVLNGCGAGGAAHHVAEALRAEGFDVVQIGNAPDFDYPTTVVMDRSGAPDKARRVAEVMGCAHVVRQVSSDAMLDVTVILGADGVWSRGRLAPGRGHW